MAQARHLTVFELRNYQMQTGRRDALIEMFEDHFIESQEERGSHVIGTFRNLEDPDRFVWIRGFETMESRALALDSFYTSETWLSRRSAANATIVDNDDVLLLSPLSGSVEGDPARRACKGARAAPHSRVAIDIWLLSAGGIAAFADWFDAEAKPMLERAGVAPLATFVTDPRPNSYPRLPVREGETVFVSVTRFADAAAFRAAEASVGQTVQPHSRLILEPTARSLMF